MKKIWTIAVIGVVLLGCKKEFLDIKPDKTLVVPHTLQDMQALLDNTTVMNSITPYLGECSSDDYYLTTTSWQSIASADAKNAYIWAKDVYQGNAMVLDWDDRYKEVFYCNVVLDGLDSLSAAEKSSSTFNVVKGSALFNRSWSFYLAAQIFCKAFSPSASSDPGIPLRLTSDINEKSTRSTVQQTYSQIISDLKSAARLLPIDVSVKTRPSKAAAFGLLAKTFLLMGDYVSAKSYADSCLSLPQKLLDYNTLNPGSSFPFARFNDEVIFHSKIGGVGNFSTSRLIIDTSLYIAYDSNDLRKSLFFKLNAANETFRGSYDGSSSLFSGIATDEVYLIRAECNVRLGVLDAAASDLNVVLSHRFKSGTYVPYTFADSDSALSTILAERRKELIFRGVRWQDLRRFNLDPKLAKTLTRNVNGQTYTLTPNSPDYVFAIPDNVIGLTGMPQNQR